MNIAFEVLVAIAGVMLTAAFVLVRVLLARANSLTQLASIIRSTRNSVVTTDVEGKIVWVNNAFTETTGYTLEEARGRSPASLLQCEESSQQVIRRMRQAIAAETEFHGEVINRTKQGRLYWLELDIAPVHNRHGKLLGFTSIQRDITVRKETQQRLVNKQEKLRSIYHASSDGILLVNSHGIFDANEKSAKLLGVERVEDLHGRQVWELAVQNLPDGQPSRAAIEAIFERVHEVGETRMELTLKRSDDEEFPAELTLTTFLHDDERWILVTFRDFSDRRLVEQWLQQMNRQLQEDLAARTEAERQIRETTAYLDVYRKIVDHHAIVAETDTAGTIVSANDAFCKISGYTRDELIGQNHRILNSGLHPRDMWRDMYRTVACGGFWHGEICNRAKNGQFYWVDTTIAPLFNDAGKLRGYFAIRADITSLKTAQTQAEAASRSKSEFLANMSHEIRTPMTAILGYADLLEELGTGENSNLLPQISTAIRTIKRNGQHLLAIINDILDISKIEAHKMTFEALTMDVVHLVREIASTMQVKSQEKGLSLTCELETPIPRCIVTDPTRLRQILVNLVGNAIKFTERGGVVLKLACRPQTPNKLLFSVVDSGIGMTPEQKNRLFEAFEQGDTSMTRRFGGTGLGLRISKRLANMLGGDITVESEIGAGSTFTLSIATGVVEGEQIYNLNVAHENNDVSSIEKFTESSTATKVSTGNSHRNLLLAGLRILVVEDGPDNQRLIKHHLTKAGASVQLVGNGRLAVEAMTADETIDGQLQKPLPFDLILMDMQMPVMDGYEATRLLRRKGATLPIWALTAHAMQADLQMCLDAGCDMRITKPIDRDYLIESCRTRVKHSASLQAIALAPDPSTVSQLLRVT